MSDPHPNPRSVRFRTLTLLWIFPSLGAAWIISSDRAWLHAGGALAAIGAVRFEQWIALALLLAHAWFAWRWWRARREKFGDQ